jgi:hypothetical protein
MNPDYVNRSRATAMGDCALKPVEMPVAEWFDLVLPDAYDEPFGRSRLFLEMRSYDG